MAHSLVTQVDRPDGAQPAPVAAKPVRRPGFLQRLCSCFSTAEERPAITVVHEAPIKRAEEEQVLREHQEKQRKLREVDPTMKRVLLPPMTPENAGKKCLVLDLDETLVHSSFQPTAVFDFQIKVEIEGIYHDVYVAKRPGVDHFLREAAKDYELIIFTASLSKYADPVLDTLDPDGLCGWRLFRDSCVAHGSQFVKDMSILGRAPEIAMILDNSPTSYMFQPEQAIPIESWFDDPQDRRLIQLLPILKELAQCDDCVVKLREFFQH